MEQKIFCVSSVLLLSCEWNGSRGGFSLNETCFRYNQLSCLFGTLWFGWFKEHDVENCRTITAFSLPDNLSGWLTEPLLEGLLEVSSPKSWGVPPVLLWSHCKGSLSWAWPACAQDINDWLRERIMKMRPCSSLLCVLTWWKQDLKWKPLAHPPGQNCIPEMGRAVGLLTAGVLRLGRTWEHLGWCAV